MKTKRFAQLISFIFHPIFFSLFIPFLIVHHRTGDISSGIRWTFFSGLFLLVGMIFFYFARPKEFLSDFDISQKEQRHLFYSISLLIAVLYFIASLIFKGILFPLSIVSLGIILGIVSFDILNYYSKISIHTAIATAYVVTIAMMYGIIPFFVTIWVVALVGWSRLYLKKHTGFEVMLGMILGTFVTLSTFAVSLFLQK